MKFLDNARKADILSILLKLDMPFGTPKFTFKIAAEGVDKATHGRFIDAYWHEGKDEITREELELLGKLGTIMGIRLEKKYITIICKNKKQRDLILSAIKLHQQ